jgi:hypothetical protein
MPACIGFHSENLLYIVTLILRSVRYDTGRRLESSIPACVLFVHEPCCSDGVMCFKHVKDYGCCVCPLIDLMTYSVKRSSCSVVYSPGKKIKFSSGMWHDNAR